MMPKWCQLFISFNGTNLDKSPIENCHITDTDFKAKIYQYRPMVIRTKGPLSIFRFGLKSFLTTYFMRAHGTNLKNKKKNALISPYPFQLYYVFQKE